MENFKNAVILGLKRYFDFEGRSARYEFWYFQLFILLTSLLMSGVDAVVFGSVFGRTGLFEGLFALGVLIPGIAVGVRRLHDIGKSGFWLFLLLIPLIGLVILIYWHCKRSEEGENQYGPNPLSPQSRPMAA